MGLLKKRIEGDNIALVKQVMKEIDRAIYKKIELFREYNHNVQVQNIVAGSLLVRNEDATNILDLAQPNAGPATAESTSFQNPRTEIDVAADPGATTYIRIVLSAALGSGVIDWHLTYEPLSDDGFVAPV